MTYFYKKANAVFRLPTRFCCSRQLLFLLFISILTLSGTPGKCTESSAKKDTGEWFVRLIVTAEDGRTDQGNVLGYLLTAKPGKDRHDLPEMAPPPSPMGDRFLSIVFSHPEWKSDMPDYASDYRPVPKDQARKDVWLFEVRTHTPGIKVVLSWKGSTGVLGRSRLQESGTGRVLVENCAAVTSYEFVLKGKSAQFVWQYQGRPAETSVRDRQQ